MNAIQFLQDYFQRNEMVWSDYELHEFLSYQKDIHEEVVDTKRWWNNVFRVIKLEDKLIGFMDAETTGDDGPEERGWKFDPSSIHFVEEYEETIVLKKYKPLQ